MKTLFYSDWNKLEICERPEPELSPDEVLLKVSACGLCGSELETFKSRSPRRTPPLIMGHEFCGEVVEKGKSAANVSVGDRVVSSCLVPCRQCFACQRGDTHLCNNRQVFGMHRMGAFAEYVNVPGHCLMPWPENLAAEAVCLAEPLTNGVHVFNLTRHLEPKIIVVIGAGSIGLMCQQAFQSLGKAETLVADINSHRLEIAKKLGAKKTINVAEEKIETIVSQYTQGQGADLVIDAVGTSKTKQQSLTLSRPGGGVVWIGLFENRLNLNTYDITLPEKQVFGSYSGRVSDYHQALKLMAENKVDVQSWTHKFCLDEGVTAFERMLEAKEKDVKAVIIPKG